RAMRRHALAAAVLPVAVLLVILAGCGDKHATRAVNPVPLTLSAQGVGGASHAIPAASSTILAAASQATDTIPVTYTRALLVIRDVRFVLPGEMDDDGADTLGMGGMSQADSMDMDDDEDGGQVRFRGPFVVDLLSGHAENLDTMMVMPGDYMRVQGHLQALRSGDHGAAAYPTLVGYTVWLEGTIDGEGGGPFSYLARIDNEFQIRGDFSVDVDTPATAFVTFDLSKWLQDRDGRFLDPRDETNDQAIKSAIRHSIKVGMDDDHDGEMDDDMHAEMDAY
ncbi:MAG TPA: hypothetical protein VFV33_18030, partial [Gemmatimonadaceae bacterium]|nr:hypothetical protein [Gemmatimonadaceae bacterium]